MPTATPTMPAPLAVEDASGATVEQLRELLLVQHTRLQRVMQELADANLLIDGFGVLLQSASSEDPFADAFALIRPVFRFDIAAVFTSSPQSGLRQLSAYPPGYVSDGEPAERFLRKALTGHVVATVGSDQLDDSRPALYIPIRFHDNQAVLMLARTQGAAGFDRRDVSLARRFSLLASQALAADRAARGERERRRLTDVTQRLHTTSRLLKEQTLRDSLTGLANRTALANHVSAVLGNPPPQGRVALAFVDLDGFKQVNDHYGHDIGDQLLQTIAERLAIHIRESDFVARISGDEFVILLQPVADVTDIRAIVDRLAEEIRHPVTIGTSALMVSASIGLAIFPEHGTTYEELRRSADLAMYRSKRHTPGGVTVFSEDIAASSRSQLDFAQHIRQVVRSQRIRAAVQPMVDIRTMSIVGFEVLARRLDADGLAHPVADFITVSEDLGLLSDVTRLVITDMADHVAVLHAMLDRPARFSFNLSARQVSSPPELRALLGYLSERFDPAQVTIEVTEEGIVDPDLFTRTTKPLIDEFGMQIAIDDFGTGSASLFRLANLEVGEVKIDRSFISGIDRHPRKQSVLRALRTLGSDLGVHVVAEGVETQGELGYLRAQRGIDIAQGFLFQRPALPEDLASRYDDLRATLARIGAAGSSRDDAGF